MQTLFSKVTSSHLDFQSIPSDMSMDIGSDISKPSPGSDHVNRSISNATSPERRRDNVTSPERQRDHASNPATNEHLSRDHVTSVHVSHDHVTRGEQSGESKSDATDITDDPGILEEAREYEVSGITTVVLYTR